MPLIQRSLEVYGHTFNLLFIRATNGAILLLYEGNDVTLGAITATVKTPLGVHSFDLTPGRREELVSKVLSEMLANLIQGFALSSFYAHRALEPEVSSQLVRKVRGLLTELA